MLEISQSTMTVMNPFAQVLQVSERGQQDVLINPSIQNVKHKVTQENAIYKMWIKKKEKKGKRDNDVPTTPPTPPSDKVKNLP
jgi:hypothetical protein